MDEFKLKSLSGKALLDIAATGKSNREVALRLAEGGWPVLPCRASPKLNAKGEVVVKAKSPLVPKPGVYRATTDRDQIEAWWKRWPEALPGLPTGEKTGLWVLDVDAPTETRADGLTVLAALTVEHGDLHTFTVATSGGGFHFFFLDPGLGNSTGRLPEGMDARGAGGYVIAPGTRLPDGRSWKIERDFALASIPNWLRAQVAPAERAELSGIHQSIGETEAGLRELARLCEWLANSGLGKQHLDLFSIPAAAGNLVGAGEILRETAERELLAAGKRMFNYKSYEPWTETELKRVIRNGLKEGSTKPLRVSPPPLSSLEDFEALIRQVAQGER